MTEKYCVTIRGAKKRHPLDTMPAILEEDGTLQPLKVFDSIDLAVETAKLHKIDHPDSDYEVRKYYGINTDMLLIEERGRWNIGKEILRTI